jgi:hypothetical protein
MPLSSAASRSDKSPLAQPRWSWSLIRAPKDGSPSLFTSPLLVLFLAVIGITGQRYAHESHGPRRPSRGSARPHRLRRSARSRRAPRGSPWSHLTGALRPRSVRHLRSLRCRNPAPRYREHQPEPRLRCVAGLLCHSSADAKQPVLAAAACVSCGKPELTNGRARLVGDMHFPNVAAQKLLLDSFSISPAATIACL